MLKRAIQSQKGNGITNQITMSVGTIVLTAMLAGDALAYKIKNCDAKATSEVSKAASFVDQNLSALADMFTMLSKSEREEFEKKWPKIVIKCGDDGPKKKCIRKSHIGGSASGGLGNTVKLCYYNLVESSQTRCYLVEVLVHEMGHANGYKRLRNHNSLSDAQKKQDKVYQLGFAANSFCVTQASKGTFQDVTLTGRVNVSLGASCDKDDQCSSGQCYKGKCVCRADGDCTGRNGDDRCFKPVGKANYCGAPCTKKNSKYSALSNGKFECRHTSKYYVERCSSGYSYRSGKCYKPKDTGIVKCPIMQWRCPKSGRDVCYTKKDCKGKKKNNITCSSGHTLKVDYRGRDDHCSTETSRKLDVTRCPIGWKKGSLISTGSNGYKQYACIPQ